MFSISKSKNSHFWGVQVLKTREYKSLGNLSLAIYENTTSCSLWQNWPLGPDGLRLKTMKLVTSDQGQAQAVMTHLTF